MSSGLNVSIVFAVVLALATAFSGDSLAAEGDITAFPENGKTFTFLQEDGLYMEVGFTGWGPDWSWMGWRSNVGAEGDTTVATNTSSVKSSGADIELGVEVRKTAPRQLTFDMSLSSSKDTDLTYIVSSLQLPEKAFGKGKVLVTSADGEEKTVEMPLARKGLGDAVKRFTCVDNAGKRTTFSLDPAVPVSSDGEARIVLAHELEADQPVEVTMTVDLPTDLTYYASGAEVPQTSNFDEWYTFQPGEDFSRSTEIGMQNWLEKPAGKHGRILAEGDTLFYNGEPIKLWGLNVCYASCAPDKEVADSRAEFYPKYGVNAVRLHKYADGPGWAGIQSEESFVEFDPEGLDRLDYFISRLKEQGVYVKLSSTFGVKLGPKDRQYVPYMDEFGKLKGGRGRVSTGHGSVYLSRELQNLQIQQIVKILEHRNPYTGLTYAEDPAVAVVELFNEDSALFYGTQSKLRNIPTLRKRAGEMFTKWLKERYGSKQALIEAWGEEALNSFEHEGLTGESWEDNTIIPAGNPWYFDPAQLEGSQAFRKQRLLDTMLFLYEIQNDFYSRYVEAIRDAGYEGEILASNWQAGRAYSHYLNLHSDYMVGMIDRHNYFGGGSGAKINNATMLRIPGSAMLSAGMQQVADRPFSLSEWIHVLPNEWGTEGPAIIGAYGMGLNGWDVSFIFQNGDDGTFSNEIGSRGWDVTAPHVMGVFPAVARQVLRGDVKESDVLATRYVHVPSLHEARLGFEDRVQQEHDVKTFDSDKVPARSLAVARCVVEFTDSYRETPEFDLSRYVTDGAYRSATNQLLWQEGERKLHGHFTMHTDATKAVVGFAEGVACSLGEVTITPKSRFGAIYVTARDRDEDIASGDNLLVVAIARARNTGMKVYDDSRILDRGKPPVVMEPVRARIEVEKPGQATVHVLDHAGRRTGRTLPVRDGTFEIDGARDKTPYYLISYE